MSHLLASSTVASQGEFKQLYVMNNVGFLPVLEMQFDKLHVKHVNCLPSSPARPI